jgi:ferredoxin
VPAVLAAGLLSAHFLRVRAPALMILPPAGLLLLWLRRPWALRAVQLLLLCGAAFWLALLAELAGARQAMGMPWGRLAVILVAVAGLTVAAAWLLDAAPSRGRAGGAARVTHDTGGPLASFVLTAALLAFVQLRVQRPMLLPERFIPGAGWLAIGALATWAGWLTERVLEPTRAPGWRARAWGLFSLVFFAQLGLGLLGLERFLMTGTLHVPVPAVILGGPLYRGEGFFMITLFLVTVVLVGPAWCSWLCYIGAWDSSLARRRRLARAPRGRGWPWLRVGLLVGTVAVALGLRAGGASGPTAAAVGLGFGGLGVLVMWLGSRRTGTLVHCSYYCPLGLVAAVLGKVSPHRLRITDACTDCGACTRACRYDALSASRVARRRPGISCTLCGDCLASCRHGALQHRLLGLPPAVSRTVFVVLVVSFHAVTLGVARI